MFSAIVAIFVKTACKGAANSSKEPNQQARVGLLFFQISVQKLIRQQKKHYTTPRPWSYAICFRTACQCALLLLVSFRQKMQSK